MPRTRTDRLRPGDVLELGVMGPETVVWVRHEPARPVCEVLVRRPDGARVLFHAAAEALHTVTERTAP